MVMFYSYVKLQRVPPNSTSTSLNGEAKLMTQLQLYVPSRRTAAPSKEHRSLQSSAKHVLIRCSWGMGTCIFWSQHPKHKRIMETTHIYSYRLDPYHFSSICTVQPDPTWLACFARHFWDASSLFSYHRYANRFLNEKPGFRLLYLLISIKSTTPRLSVSRGFHDV